MAVKESVTLVVGDANEAEERLGQKSTWKTCLSPPSLPPRVITNARSTDIAAEVVIVSVVISY